MIIDKKTGDIIFSEGQVIKAGMTIDEIKASRVMELVSKGQEEKMEHAFYYLQLVIPNAHGHKVFLALHMYDGIVSSVSMTLGDYYDFYDKGTFNAEEYRKLAILQRDFLSKVLQEYAVPDDTHYDWGHIQMRVDYRDMEELEIIIDYYLDD